MKLLTKSTFSMLTLFGLSLGSAVVCSAQNASYDFNSQRPAVRTTAGMHLTIPFGAQSKRPQDTARFGLMLATEREYERVGFGVPRRVRANALDFGFGFNGKPTMLMGNKDVYTPLFAPLPEDKDRLALKGNGASRNTILIIAGGVLATGAIVALASSGNGKSGGSNDDRDGNDADNG